MTEYGVIAFVNTHAAISAQSYLKGKFHFTVIPTPREITTSCGISIRFDICDLDGIQNAMAGFTQAKEMYGIYGITHECGKINVKKMN